MDIKIADLQPLTGLVLDPPAAELLCFAATVDLQATGDFAAMAAADLRQSEGTAVVCIVLQASPDVVRDPDLTIAEIELRHFLQVDETHMRAPNGTVHVVSRTYPVHMKALTPDQTIMQ